MASVDLPPTFDPLWHKENEIKRLEYKRLGQTDLSVALMSFGGAHMSSGVTFDEQTMTPIAGHETAVETLQQALKLGFNYIDTAPFYGAGRSEIVIGKALETVPRNVYYIATKVGRTPDCSFDFSAAKTVELVDRSLKCLGVEYLDVIQVHDVEFAEDIDVVINETLPALDKIREAGKARYIGITGYPLHILKEIVERSQVKIDIVLSYCRFALFDNSLKAYIDFFKNKELGIINAAALGMGLLTNNPVPEWHPAGHEIRSLCEEVAKFCISRNVDISRLAVAHVLNANDVDTNLIGMKDLDVLKDNYDLLINGLTEREEEVFAEVKEKFFANVEASHWEGLEVAKFRNDPLAFQERLIALLTK